MPSSLNRGMNLPSNSSINQAEVGVGGKMEAE